MSRTESTMLALGTIAPEFSLFDTVTEKTINLQTLKGDEGTVIMFICNHCPFVIHVNEELVRLANLYQSKGIGFIAISSNYVKDYPQDGPDIMKLKAAELGYTFPYLHDATQKVAKDYKAACTPDFYFFDGDLKLIYRGQLDDSRPNNDKPVTGYDLRNAMDTHLNTGEIVQIQKPSIGCNIKWAPTV